MKGIISRVISFLFIAFIGELYSCNNNRGEIEDSNIWTDTIPKEYLRLLKLQNGCCDKLTDSVVLVNSSAYKYRNAISSFYIANKYYLQVYKMDTGFNYSLRNAIKESFSDAHTWIYSRYILDERTKMEFLYKFTKPKIPQKIYLDLYGDSTQALKKNDTIAYYYSKCVTFSIKFGLQQPNDIYGESHSQRDSEIPLEIMFLKKNNKLYLLILSAKDDGIKIKPGALYNFLFR
jgi:hypothetical protein